MIAGPNGAGKTTFAEQYLPSLANCFEFLNADLIAAGLSPYSPDQQNLRAGSLMLERMRELVAKRTTFAFETTLSGRSYLRMIPRWRTVGYQVRLYFLYLPSAETRRSCPTPSGRGRSCPRSSRTRRPSDSGNRYSASVRERPRKLFQAISFNRRHMEAV